MHTESKTLLKQNPPVLHLHNDFTVV